MLPILLKDAYKIDHRRQHPQGTQLVYLNFTPRTSRIQGQDEVVFFGLQYMIKKYLMDEFDDKFFNVEKSEVLFRYKRMVDNILGGDMDVSHIGDLHDLGYLPISIRALPEGSLVPLKCPMFTIENTDDRFIWLTNMLEILISTVVWLPCTDDFASFQANDFSIRGMQGVESTMLSGAGHTISSWGTDSIFAIDFLETYHFANSDEELVLVSVPANEHSVKCAGSKEGELETYRRLINDVYPSGIVSIVSDTWDYFQVLTEFMPALKDDIMKRDGTVTIRPDSGDPVKIICGDPDSNNENIRKGSIELLWEIFGGTTNSKGYKTLDSHVKLIYGDGITYEQMDQICSGLAQKGFASDNVVFDLGSFSYSYVTRDTFGFGMKVTAIKINGEYREIYKDPVTDNGSKNSAKGFIAVRKNVDDGKYFPVYPVTHDQADNDEMQEVFRDGKLLVDQSLSEIRH